jgi:hypothetical protein
VLARRPAAEVAPREQDRRVGRAVKLEVGVFHPVEEEELAVPGTLDPLQELLRDDLVRVDVGTVEHGNGAGHGPKRPHASSLTSAKRPATAAAAAIAGLSRWVRPPAPWRPSKLRFEVEAHRSPG